MLTTVADYSTGCPTCHIRESANTVPLGTEYNSARSGAHVDHDHGCATCHNALPTSHYAGIDTLAMDAPGATLGNATYSVEYTDSTAALVAATQGYFSNTATSGSCATVDCHSPQTPTAWDYSVATCGTCHADAIATNAHAAHIYNGATPDHTDCDNCHPSSTYQVQATGTHTSFVSGTHASTGTVTVDFVAGIGKTGAGGTTTCVSATMCHQRETAVTWNNTTVQMTCNTCHYYNASPTAAGNVGTGSLTLTHNAHFYGAPTSVVCNDCHPSNTGDINDKRTHLTTPGAGNDGALIAARAAAVMDEATVTATALGHSGTDVDPAMAACDNWQCHDPGDPGFATTTYKATWGGTNGTCTFCHGDDTTHPTSGSHGSHLAYDATYVCGDCHTPVVAGTYTHMNRAVGIKAGITYAPTASLTDYTTTTYGNCYGSVEGADDNFCHAVAATGNNPAWNTATDNCALYCHYGAAADVENFVGNDKDISRINTGAEYTTYGHGAATRGTQGCAVNCHLTTVGHAADLAASGNPFRLGMTYTASDTFCSNTTTCHVGALTSVVKGHTNELMTSDKRT